MAPLDPHSFTDFDQPKTEFVELNLNLNFEKKTIQGVVSLYLDRSADGILFLDTRDLSIFEVIDSESKSVNFELVQPDDSIKGTLLKVYLNDKKVTIKFQTSPEASALQWLDAEQTAGGKLPYIFTQCQSIHARSIFPCQDSPRVRIKYKAQITVPKEMNVVMSAAHIDRHVSADVATVNFQMDQPIPPYLFALAAGDIAHADISDRVRVYAEPSIIQSAANEFCDTESMIGAAESIFGKYEWDRFDMLLMPPSFPYGGMENPRIVFLTPSLLVGDKSLVNVVAHELAHSWTGNLITNASMNDFWLNEGWTVYAERRILESIYGYDFSQLHATIGLNHLRHELARFKDRMQFTALKTDMQGIDPDETYGSLPYEKGYLFLKRIEHQVGRPSFDAFIQKYIHTFRFHSITTEDFMQFLTAEFTQISKNVDLKTWVFGIGLPDDAVLPSSPKIESIKTLAKSYLTFLEKKEKTDSHSDFDFDLTLTSSWSAIEWQIFLESFPKKISKKAVLAMDDKFAFSESNNLDMRVEFLSIAAESACENFFPKIESTLSSIGRMKYLKPLYKGLCDGGFPKMAKETFLKNKKKYHIIAQNVIDGLLTQNV